MEDYIGIALRVSIMYIYILALLRLTGKRSIGQLSAMDLVVTTIIGDMFDDLFLGNIPLAQGLIGMGVIVLIHTLVEFAVHKSSLVDRLAAGTPTVVVKSGSVQETGLARERTSLDELWAELRSVGEDKMQEVQEASWEPNGSLSVLKEIPARELQKQDLPKLKEALR